MLDISNGELSAPTKKHCVRALLEENSALQVGIREREPSLFPVIIIARLLVLLGDVIMEILYR